MDWESVAHLDYNDGQWEGTASNGAELSIPQETYYAAYAHEVSQLDLSRPDADDNSARAFGTITQADYWTGGGRR